MTALTNRAGPTRIWKTIKGKSVRTNDGKDIGKIKEISENHLQIEQGKVHKHSFWVPKYVADAFDGKVLWLLLNEEEVRGRYQYGAEPPTGENYTSEFEKFKKTVYGQKISYSSDFNENIRVVENYGNIRDLKSGEEADTQIPGTAKKEADMPGKEEDQKEQNIKDIETTTKTENIQSTEYRSKKQPINADPLETKSTAQPVQPVVVDSKKESEAAIEIKQRKKDNNNFSSSPIKLPTSYTKQETPHVEDVQSDGDRDKRNLSVDRKESASPVRITSDVSAPKQPTISTSTPTTRDKQGNASPITSPLSSVKANQKNKETDSSPPTIVKLDATKAGQKPYVDIPTKSGISASRTAASPTPTAVISDKNKDTKTNTETQPVLSEVTQPIIEVRAEEQQIMPISANKEEQKLDLPTKSTSIEEAKPTPTNLMPANPERSYQISLYSEGYTVTNENENVNSALIDYFNPFLAGMSMWQAWLNMCNEFAAIGANLSINWLESFWKSLIPSNKEATKHKDEE